MKGLDGTTLYKEPIACTEGELREFASLVRLGFGSTRESLDGRIRCARRLALHYAADDTLAAVAALKGPGREYREEVFRKAAVCASPGEYELELGWVFVVPVHRGKGIAQSLCRELLARVPASSVFATTRPNNSMMIRILVALGFEREGRPYPRRGEELVVFLRPSPPGRPIEHVD